MLIPSGEGEGMVNSQLVTQGNFNSPSRGLAVVVKKRIPTTRGSASRGRNLFFTTPAKPWLGELKLPFVTRWEFIIPTTRGFATRGRNYTIPSPPPEGITSITDCFWQTMFRCSFCVFLILLLLYSATKPMVDSLAVYDNDAIAVEPEDPDTYNSATYM